MKLIVNIPAFNEEEKIASTISSIPRSLKGVSEVLVQVIDDGSHDRTSEEAKAGGADFVIKHKSNRGLGVMFRTMRENALKEGADIVVNIDADGQFDPLDIQKMIDPVINEGVDMVIADRFSEKSAENIPLLKEKLNRLAAWLVGRALSEPVADLTCGFRAHSTEALLRLNNPTGFTYTQETIIDAVGKNLSLRWMPVNVQYFEKRKSRVVKTIWSYVNNSARIIIKAFRDVRPMKFFGFPGVILLTLSFLTFCYFLGLYFPDMKVTPHRNVLFASLSLFLIGLQFLIFALIADMVKSTRSLTEETLYLLRRDQYKK